MSERAGDVIDRIGMGWFQHKLLLACGASWATDAMEVLLIGFAIPSLIADWNLSAQQAGSLASALFFMLKHGKPGDKPDAQRATHMMRALAMRVGLSVLLFLCILLAWQLGYIQPSGISSSF